jgi:hypothetical protein
VAEAQRLLTTDAAWYPELVALAVQVRSQPFMPWMTEEN